MICIINGRLSNFVNDDCDTADILISGKKIVKTAKKLSEKEVENCSEIIDAAGRLVTPGLIDAHTHMGMAGASGENINEIVNPIQPGFRALDALDYQSKDFAAAVRTGVTTVAAGPGSSNLMGGTFMVIKTAGDSLKDRIVCEENALKFALGENPKMNYKKKNMTPCGRMGEAALIREKLYQAKEYRQQWIRYQENPSGSRFKYDIHMHSLMRAFDGMLIKIHAHEADDILMALRIAKEFHLNISIEHCTEGYKVLKELKESGCKVCLGPIAGGKGKAELSGKRFDTPAIFEKAGIPFALVTDFGVIPMEGLLMQACLMIKNGLSRKAALDSLTIDAAKALEAEDRLGSIEAGKDADLVIWNASPFETAGEAAIVMIDGKIRYEKGVQQR